jgi:hypothetical protein
VEEVRGDQRNVYNEEHHNLHSSPDIILLMYSWRMVYVRHVTRMGGTESVYKILLGEDERKRLLVGPRHR